MAQATINIRMDEDVFDGACNGFDAELYAKDPFFNRATQAELRRRIADMDTNGDSVLVDFDPTEQEDV